MNHAFTAHLRQYNQLAILDLSGEINGFAERELHEAYVQAEAFSPSVIALNMSQVSYINSTGIALIVSLLALARKSGRRLTVFGLSDHYLEIFRITRLADFIRIFSDESALRADLPVPSN